MKYCLFRILGNDIPGRHGDDQTCVNLAFILKNEPDFVDCEKRFLLNRVADKSKLVMMRTMIDEAGYRFHELPFDPLEYKRLNGMENRAHYLTNVNAARNHCIDLAKGMAEYILPFDGGSMFRQDGWDSFESNARFNSGDPYFVLGQWRVPDFKSMLSIKHRPILKEEYRHGRGRVVIAMRELAIAFGLKHDCMFDPSLKYGQADKVELLWRLGVAGIWDHWEPEIKANSMRKLSEHFGRVKMAGWVARLPSGNQLADEDNMERGKTRSAGVPLLVERVNGMLAATDDPLTGSKGLL
jgi:hypothetical protein